MIESLAALGGIVSAPFLDANVFAPREGWSGVIEIPEPAATEVEIGLVSDPFVPAAVDPSSTDPRTLGVNGRGTTLLGEPAP